MLRKEYLKANIPKSNHLSIDPIFRNSIKLCLVVSHRSHSRNIFPLSRMFPKKLFQTVINDIDNKPYIKQAAVNEDCLNGIAVKTIVPSNTEQIIEIV